jgi:hypothetical protein
MKLHRDHLIMAISGATIALALVVFPDWIAVRSFNDETAWLGHGWIFSPPPLPESFAGMRVERNGSSNIYLAIVVLVAGADTVAFGPPRKAKPE